MLVGIWRKRLEYGIEFLNYQVSSDKGESPELISACGFSIEKSGKRDTQNE